MFWRFVTLLAILLNNNKLGNPPTVAFAQEAPFLTIDAGQEYEAQIANVPQLRQDLCDRYRQVSNGTLALADAIRGLSIVPVLSAGNDQFFRIDPESGGINAEFPGVLGLLADEFCRRAGCTWRDKFAVLRGVVGASFDWDEHLFWSIDRFDVAFDWYSLVQSRLKRGAAFPEPWYEGSEIMVVKNTGSEYSTNKANISGWAEPFARDLWLLIIAFIVVSGVVYWLMLRLDSCATRSGTGSAEEDEEEERVTLVRATTDAAFNFTSHTHLPASNKTHVQIFAFSLSFLALVIITSYTANLTSFLVVDKKPHRYNSIEEAVRSGARICVWSGTASETRLKSMFPTAAFVPRSHEKESLQSLHNDICDVAVVSISGWSTYQRQTDVNGQCDLEWVGRPVVRAPAGVVVQADSGVLCTSLLGDVLTVHLREMIAEGIVEEAWEAQIAFTADMNCDLMAADPNGKEDRLSAGGLAGIFVLHGAVTFGALLYALYARFLANRADRAAGTNTSSNERDVVKHGLSTTIRMDEDTSSSAVWDEIREQREQLRDQREELAGIARQLQVITTLMKSKSKKSKSSSSSATPKRQKSTANAQKSTKQKQQPKPENDSSVV